MLQLKVHEIKWEQPDISTFFLAELSHQKIHYLAGQFITLVFNHHSEEIRRSYSLSSSPEEKFLSITVKRIENGEISRFLLTKIKPGDILSTVEPAGRFTIANFTEEKDIFFFAAGSGIVPVFSILKNIFYHPGRSRITLIYSNSSEKSVLFKDELDMLAGKYPDRLKIIHLLSSHANRLNNLKIEQLVRQHLNYDATRAEFYLCGPFAYMRTIRLTLLYLGFEQRQIRKENFVIETIPVADSSINFQPRKVTIHFNKKVYDIVVAENQSILQAALQSNIQLPYSCRVGDCSTCAAICKRGAVKMVKNDVLTDADLAAGWVLICTGHPITDDVVIEYNY